MFRILQSRISLRTVLVAGLLGVIVIAFVTVSVPVSRKLQDLSSANSDNVQWTLAQVEVEYFSFKTALTQDVATPRAEPDEIRQRFDIFYSRITTLRDAAVFTPLRQDPDYRAALGRVVAFLDESVAVIDASDARLMIGRRAMLEGLTALRDDVRALSLGGISTFARLADTRREAVLDTLRLTASVAMALIIGLGLALVVLLQMFQEGQRRAHELRLTGSRLRAIVTTSLAAILVVDRKGRVLDYNGAAEKVFGYTREEMLGAPMGDMIIPDHLRDAHEAGMARYLRTGIPHVIGQGRVELEARRKSGEVFPVELSIATAQSEDGEIFVSFLRDISARVQAENDLREARDRALAGEKAKADLLAVMSHEMRTPLNGLLGTLDLLQETDLTAAQKGHVQNMLTSGHMLLHHVGDVLEITRMEAGKVPLNKVDFDLAALVEDLASSQAQVAQAANTDLSVSVDARAAVRVHGDPMRVRQILLNLLGNALKFTRDGAVALEAEALGDDLFEFRVTDTGIGIAEADRARIFEDFVTLDASYGRAAEGTGLGLGITKRIVDALGGEIGVESELGEGSLFWVRLPLSAATQDPPSAAVPRDAPAAGPDTGPLDILLVEDNAINQDVATALLEGMGHKVTVAGDGQEGVACAARQPFDVILMDISMPRMDGVEATRLIRSSGGPNAGTRIVAATANALPDDVARFRDIGMDDVLTKPIRATSLRAILLAQDDGDAPARGLVDIGVVRELQDVLGSDTVARLVSDTEAQVMEIMAGVPDAEAVHKLAGAVAIVGGSALRTRLVEAETRLRAGEPGGLGSDEAVRMWQATRLRIEAILAAEQA